MRSKCERNSGISVVVTSKDLQFKLNDLVYFYDRPDDDMSKPAIKKSGVVIGVEGSQVFVKIGTTQAIEQVWVHENRLHLLME